MKITDMLWIIVALVITYFVGRLTAPSNIVIETKVDTLYKYNTVTLTDTVHNWLPKFDTVYITKDSIQIPMSAERLDTNLINDKDTLSLQITRYPYPIYYNLNYKWSKTSEIQTVIKEVYIQQKESWLNKFSIGVSAGYGINFQGEVKPTLNLGVNYKLF